MKQRKLLGWLIVGLVVGALAIGVIPAFAQTATPPTTTPATPRAGMWRGGMMMCGQAGLDAAAKALKMTSDELKAQLWGGQTLSGLADKAGVNITDVQSAVQAACQQAQIDAINQAVKDGKITQANADWLIEGIQKGYIGAGKGGFGFGRFGMGFGGMMEHGRGFGRGFGMPKNGTPNNTTPQSNPAPSSYSF